MIYLFIAVLWGILEAFLIVFLSVRIFRIFKFGNDVPAAKLWKSFWFIYLVPGFIGFALLWIAGRFNLESPPHSVLFVMFLIFLILWYFVMGSKLGLSGKKATALLFLYLVLAFTASSIRHLFIKTYFAASNSMENTLLQGDYLISNRIIYGHSFFNRTKRYFQFQQPQRGDLVLFAYPEDMNKTWVKRCVGRPGGCGPLNKRGALH